MEDLTKKVESAVVQTKSENIKKELGVPVYYVW
jgi:hypothetical protein